MPLANASILVDGTVATTGGTATTLESKGGTSNNHNLFLDDGSLLQSQTEIQASTSNPKVSTTAPNGYTQARNTIKLKVPLVLDNGNTTVNTITITQATDIETTDAEKLSMRVTAAQLLHDSDFVKYWDSQSCA